MALSDILGHPAVAAALTGYAGHTEGLRKEREKRQKFNREVAKMGIDRKLGVIDRSMEATLAGEKARGKFDPESKHYDPAAHQQYKYREWQMSEGPDGGRTLRAMIEEQKREIERLEEEQKAAEELAKVQADQERLNRERESMFLGQIQAVQRAEITPTELNNWLIKNPDMLSSPAYTANKKLFEARSLTDEEKTAFSGHVPSVVRPIDLMYQDALMKKDQRRETEETERQQSGWLGEEWSPYDPNRDRSAEEDASATDTLNLGVQPSTADSLGASADTSGVAPADSVQVAPAAMGGTSDRSGISVVDSRRGSMGLGDANNDPAMKVTGAQVHDQRRSNIDMVEAPIDSTVNVEQNQPPMKLTGSEVHNQVQAQVVPPEEYGPQTLKAIATLEAERGLDRDKIISMMISSGVDMRM